MDWVSKKMSQLLPSTIDTFSIADWTLDALENFGTGSTFRWKGKCSGSGEGLCKIRHYRQSGDGLFLLHPPHPLFDRVFY